MSDNVLKNTLWCEKYRPQTVEDCILPARLKDIFKEMVSSGEIRHLLLVGSAGTGKCLDPSEKIDILVDDVTYDKLINFINK